jgi:hypothetical protein
VNNSSNEEMSIGGQITAILKLEYPSMVKVGPKKQPLMQRHGVIIVLPEMRMG